MKKHYRPFARFLAVSAFALLSSSPLFAIPIRVLAWDQEIAERKLAFGDAKSLTPIVGMHPSKRTKPFEVATGDAGIVVSAVDKKLPDGTLSATQIKIPDGLRQPLLIILPDTKNPSGIRLFLLDDETSSFAWGTMRFVNATPKPLVFTYDKKMVDLKSSWTPQQADPGGEIRNMSVNLFYRDQPNEPIYSAVWEQNPDVRKLVFLVPGEDSRQGPIAMKIIPEDRNVAKIEADLDKKAQSGGKKSEP